jgi:hypothetical protein
MIIIGNNTKVSNLKVNNLMTPQSASQAAKQSYNLLAPKSPREMSAEEVAGWGKDLFGASFASIPQTPEPPTAAAAFEENVVSTPTDTTTGEPTEPMGP